MRLFRTLLFHAVRYEREGWRVWIDTLALLHMWLEKCDHFNATSSPGSSRTTPSVHSRQSNTRSSVEDIGVDLTEPDARRMIQSELSPGNHITDIAPSEATSPPNGSKVSSVEPPVPTDSGGSMTRDSMTQASVSGADQTMAVQSPARRSRGTLFLRDFRWSMLHQLLLDDLLCSIEEDLGIVSLRSSTDKPGLFYPVRGESTGITLSPPSAPSKDDGTGQNASSPETRAFTLFEDSSNATFAINLIHFLSDCTDMLVSASGGLLPLLAAASTATFLTPICPDRLEPNLEALNQLNITLNLATYPSAPLPTAKLSPNPESQGDIGTFETVEGMTMSDALSLTLRIAYLLDLCILHVDLHTIEKQRSMASGALVRQFARLCEFPTENSSLYSVRLIGSRLAPSHLLPADYFTKCLLI
ncbi:unnamed protein product [Echinostoma caproni]|uniref:DUF4704 domain-containing protein n=1 Tax=Echinostoma caproni TaxID=27848 RepID=A0A183BA30_9TREM|nr:unnamed protein product [Echinostoma caproni]